MPLSISPNPFHITSELGATQDITVSGLTYYSDPDNCSLSLYVKVNNVTVKTINVVPTASSYTFSNIDFNSVKNAIYDAANGLSLTGAVQIQVINKQLIPLVSISLNTNVGNLTIAGRNSALVLTQNIIDISLSDPANLAFSWTRPHSAFRARIKFYVFNGTDYTLIFNRYGFGATTPSSSGDLRNYGGTDYASDIIAAMMESSPRAYKVELFTQFNANTLVDLGTVNDAESVPNGMEYPAFGGRIKVYGTSFAPKPVKVFDGLNWLIKPVKYYDGSAWKKSKN